MNLEAALCGKIWFGSYPDLLAHKRLFLPCAVSVSWWMGAFLGGGWDEWEHNLCFPSTPVSLPMQDCTYRRVKSLGGSGCMNAPSWILVGFRSTPTIVQPSQVSHASFFIQFYQYKPQVSTDRETTTLKVCLITPAFAQRSSTRLTQ